MNLSKDEQEQLDLQLKLANQLQQADTRGDAHSGTQVPTGSVYIPPNPLATATQMHSHLQGILDAASGKEQQSALNKKMQDALDSWQSVLQGTDQNLANYDFSPDKSGAASTLGSPNREPIDEDTSEWQ
jgi:hypothetical protein